MFINEIESNIWLVNRTDFVVYKYIIAYILSNSWNRNSIQLFALNPCFQISEVHHNLSNQDLNLKNWKLFLNIVCHQNIPWVKEHLVEDRARIQSTPGV